MGPIKMGQRLVTCWCFVSIGCLIEANYGASISTPSAGEGSLLLQQVNWRPKRQQAEFVPLARVPPHPWQAAAPHRNRNHPHYWQRISEGDDLFFRSKRKSLKGSTHVFGQSHTNHGGETEGDAVPETSTVSNPSAKIENSDLITETPKPFRVHRLPVSQRGTVGLHRFKKTYIIDSSDKDKALNKLGSTYSPLPYGGPSSLNRDDEAEATFGAHQASSLPVARTAYREKEIKERAELKLPIPDSEIPSPGHYRQPIDHSLLRSSGDHHSTRSENKKQREDDTLKNKTVDAEALRILMEVIKSLREVSIISPSNDNNTKDKSKEEQTV